MTIPFLDLIKNVKARLFPATEDTKPVTSRLVRAEKTHGERLRKTVVPKASAARGTTSGIASAPAVPPVSASKATETNPPPPPMAFDPAPKFASARDTRKTVAFASQPDVGRVLSLQISDILDQLPSEQIKPRESFDTDRAIMLKASDIEKGMATGKPTISLASIYQQAPEIFSAAVSPSDSTMVALPFGKVLEQFEAARVRPDQVAEPDVPQLDTPFLKVTLEEKERCGTAINPLKTSSLAPKKVEPATAKTIAAAEPEPAVQEVPTPTAAAAIAFERNEENAERPSALQIKASSPGTSAAIPFKRETQDTKPALPMTHQEIPTKSAAPIPLARKEQSSASAPGVARKIPFQFPSNDLPPNGTGVPDSEKVPASSGPPVPTVSMPATPARVPFTSPSEQLRPKFTLVPGVEPKKKPASTAADIPQNENRISLSLQSVLAAV